MNAETRGTRAPMVVAVAGGTGLIGTALVAHLRARGHTVHRLVRSSRDLGPGDRVWNPAGDHLDRGVLAGCDAVVNLAGAPIAQRWSSAHKREILESRVRSTSLIASAVAEMDVKPSVVLSGSAIGYYGNRGAEMLDESSGPASDFLSTVVQRWEDAAAPIASAGVRLVMVRSGIVLSAKGGALAKILPPFKLGAGGRVGNGQQWMSWISLHDHVRAMEHLLATDVRGAVNLVAPNPVTNDAFTEALGHVLSRPTLLAVPAIALELAFGEMARATLLASQRVLPTALTASGFSFDFPVLEAALRRALSE